MLAERANPSAGRRGNCVPSQRAGSGQQTAGRAWWWEKVGRARRARQSIRREASAEWRVRRTCPTNPVRRVARSANTPYLMCDGMGNGIDWVGGLEFDLGWGMVQDSVLPTHNLRRVCYERLDRA